MNEKGASFAYLFEAKGIQRYILSSGKLRDVIGASDLLAQVAGPETDLVGHVAAACGLDDLSLFSRRAGGAFCVHFKTKGDLDRFRALWRLTLASALPGLEFIDACAEGTGENAEAAEKAAIEKVYKGAGAVRENGVAQILPRGGPATDFAQRTGRPAVYVSDQAAEDEDGQDPRFDQVLEPIRIRANALFPRVELGGQSAVVWPRYDALARRILPEQFNSGSELDGGAPLLLPRNLSDQEENTLYNPLFPFPGDVPRLALVHVDLSGLGELYRQRGDSAGRAGRLELSKEIEDAVLGAISATIAECLIPPGPTGDAGGANTEEGDGKGIYVRCSDPPRTYLPANPARTTENPRSWVYRGVAQPGDAGGIAVRVAPFRPIVAGGDDITFLVRSDLAVGFSAQLLGNIEEQGKELGLSACAGLALVRATTPFVLAHDLADQLCAFAKKRAKEDREPPYCSALAFYSPMGTLAEEFADIVLRGELTAADGVLLTSAPYWAGRRQPKAGDPHIDKLSDLVAALGEMRGTGGLREIKTTLQISRSEAEKAWLRWRVVQKSRGPEKLEELDDALTGCGVAEPETTFIADGRTPLFDALTLLGLTFLEAEQ